MPILVPNKRQPGANGPATAFEVFQSWSIQGLFTAPHAGYTIDFAGGSNSPNGESGQDILNPDAAGTHFLIFDNDEDGDAIPEIILPSIATAERVLYKFIILKEEGSSFRITPNSADFIEWENSTNEDNGLGIELLSNSDYGDTIWMSSILNSLKWVIYQVNGDWTMEP